MTSPTLRRLLVSASLAGTLGICSPAAAQNLAEAKKLFDEGEKAEQAGDCATAVDKWKGVLSIKETPQIHLRIGRCQEKLGHLSGAVTAYEKAVQLAGGNAQVLDVANQQLKALEPRVPTLTLKWDAAVGGASVQLDGQPVTENGKPVRVDPGTHTVEATAEGRNPFKKTLDVAEAARESVRISLEPKTSTPPSETPPEESGPALSPWPFVVMGGGVVAGAIAIPLVVVGMGDLDEVYTHCTENADGRVCPPEYEDDISGVKVKYGVAGALGAVSAIALGVGVTWLVLDLTSTPEEPKPQALVVAPWAGAEGAGLVIGGQL